MHYADTGGDIIAFFVVLVIVGAGQLIKFLAKLGKQASEDSGKKPTRSSGRKSDHDLWQPQQSAKKQDSGGPPPVPGGQHQVAAAAAAVSKEAARAVAALERMDDSFQAAQNRVYDYEASDIFEDASGEFGIDRRHAASHKRKVKINLRGRKKLRQAVIAREILDRPRCFDI